MPSTSILVRVQAKGGKFIGPDAGYSLVTIKEAASGEILAQGIATGGSGNLLQSFVPSATRNPVVTTQLTGAQSLLWLSALPPTIPPAAGYFATLDIDAPTLVEFTAEGLTDTGAGSGQSVTQTMWITPGADLTAEPGLVLVVPGLIVKNVSVTGDASATNVTATITMACGCPIDTDTPWLYTEFFVTATATDATGKQVSQTMQLQSRSTFVTSKPLALRSPGRYTVTVEAVQPAEANVGSASISVTIPG